MEPVLPMAAAPLGDALLGGGASCRDAPRRRASTRLWLAHGGARLRRRIDNAPGVLDPRLDPAADRVETHGGGLHRSPPPLTRESPREPTILPSASRMASPGQNTSARPARAGCVAHRALHTNTTPGFGSGKLSSSPKAV